MMNEETNRISVSKEANRSGKDDSLEHVAGKHRLTKKIPHYLRASTGSCHDACKYGHPHKSIDESVRSARKRMSALLPNGEKTTEIQIFVDKKVKKAVQSDKLEISTDKGSAPANVNSKKNFPSSRRSPVHDPSRLVKQQANSCTKSPSPAAPELIKKVVRSPAKSSLSDALKISKQEVGSAAKRNVSAKRIPLNPKESNAPVIPSKSNSRVAKPSSSFVKHEIKVADNSRTSRVGAFMKTLVPPTATLSRKRTSNVGLKNILHQKTSGKDLKDQNQKGQCSEENQILIKKAEPNESSGERVEEKTLHMIEFKEDLSIPPKVGLLVHSPSPLSPESLNSSSRTNSLSFTSHDVDDQCELDTEYTDSEADGSISNYNSSGDSNAADGNKKEENLTHNSNDKHHASLNLKFRKGKVIQPQSEANSPRKLRFRQGRTLGDSQSSNGGAQRKNYKKNTSNDERKEPETGVAKVVLKHQETEIKDEQVLLNNVIEETASKLVEKRKSKVKALVGAFETVISLQERKPSAADR